MTLKDLVIKYRTENGLSQRQFALQCGLSNGYISMIERGVNPTIRELYERNTATEKSASPHLGSYFFVHYQAAKKRQTCKASASFTITKFVIIYHLPAK